MFKATNFSRCICVPNWSDLNKKFEDRRSMLPVWDGSFDRGLIYTAEFTAVFLGSYTGGGGSWDCWILEDEIYSYRGRGPIFKVDTVVSPTNLVVEVVVPRDGFKASWDDLTEGETIEITGKDFHHFERIPYRPVPPKWKTTNLKIRGTRDELLINLSEGGCDLGAVAVSESGRKSVCVEKVIDPHNKNPNEYRWFTVGEKISIQTQNYGPASLRFVQVDEDLGTFIFEVIRVSKILNLPTKQLTIGQKLVFALPGLIDLVGKDINDRTVAESLV